MTWVLLLELLAKSGVIAGAGLGLSALLRFRSASDRAAVLRAAVCLLLALPPFLVIGPNLPLAWLSPTEAPAAVAAPGASWSVDLQPVADATLNGALPAAPPWALIVALVYSAGLLLVAGRFVVGVWTLGRWTGDGRPVTHRLWTEALRRLDASGRTRLIASPRIDAPLSWGLPPGVVLISEDCLKRPETAPAVLAHELAHIRRGDWMFLLLSRLAVALFWFNPLVWALHATLSARTEDAADAAAVAQVDRQTYARALVDLASDFKAPAALGPAALGMGGSHKSLTRRIARIMKTPRRLPSRPLTLALSIGALAAVATPLAAVELTARAAHTAQAPAAPRTQHIVLTPTTVAWVPAP
ncbi:M56 family metallopeptidase, partial [Brevundimonas sp.]|uniref:M56 family metallopeptidase n=1 Tax=Brevundimonas sp. TaxID=1871086 RepID=UPI003D6C8533